MPTGEGKSSALDKNIVRYLEDPPEEQFEATWRDALSILESAGQEAGFVLLVARDKGGTYETAFVVSSGRDRISAKALFSIVQSWIEK